MWYDSQSKRFRPESARVSCSPIVSAHDGRARGAGRIARHAGTHSLHAYQQAEADRWWPVIKTADVRLSE
jgi:hypothetical protein